MAFNDKMADQWISQSIDIERFSEGLRAEVLAFLNELEGELTDLIDRYDLEGVSKTSVKYRRLETMISQTRGSINATYRDINRTTNSQLIELADIQRKAIPELYNTTFRADIMTVALTPGDVKALVNDELIMGGPAKQWWAKQSTDLQHRFATQMRVGVGAGETNQQLIQRVRGKKVAGMMQGGIMDASRNEASALVRTSVQTISNEVISETYKANADLLRGVQALATLDTRTTEICRARSGSMWDMNGNPLPESPRQEPFPGPPPWHFNCRSVLIPITKSWNDLIEEQTGKKADILDTVPNSTRASMNGQVAGDITYDDWLKSQPEAVQREALGDAKWKLWSEDPAKITTAQLADQSGNALTIDQLRAINSPSEGPVAKYAAEANQIVGAKATKDIETILAKMEDYQGATFDLGDMPVNFARQVGSTLVEHANMAEGAFAKDFQGLTYRPLADDTLGVAYFSPQKKLGSISLNSKLLGDEKLASNLFKQGYEANWFVQEDVTDLLRHELGHALHFSPALTAVTKPARLYLENHHPEAGWLSRYGVSDVKAQQYETFAESYALAFKTPKDKRSGWLQGFVTALRSGFEKLGYQVPAPLQG